MPRTRIVVNGLPFTVDGEGTPEQLAGALEKQLTNDPTLYDDRRKQLGLNEDDMLVLASQAEGNSPTQAGAYKVETSGPVNRFLIGAGRTLTSQANGITQLFTGDEKDDEIARREANEKELFAKLDDQGIGAEDIGQLAPDVIAFLGSGGLTSIMARGATLGFIQPTSGDSGGTQRAVGSLLSGVLAAAGPGTARAASAVLQTSKKVGPGMVNAVTHFMKKSDLPGQVANVRGQAMDFATRNANPQMRELGKIALDRTTDIVRAMNDKGKDSFVASTIMSAVHKHTRQVGNGNILDMAGFNREILTLGDRTIKKALGPALGKRILEIRNLFDELGRLGSVPKKEAMAIAGSMLTKPEARALANAIGVSKVPEVKQSLAKKLVESSLIEMHAAGAGAQAGAGATQGATQAVQGQ